MTVSRFERADVIRYNRCSAYGLYNDGPAAVSSSGMLHLWLSQKSLTLNTRLAHLYSR